MRWFWWFIIPLYFCDATPAYASSQFPWQVSESAAPAATSIDSPQESIALFLAADALLLCGAALFAGLTLSLMGLDTLSLEIIATSGQSPDRDHAAKILPIRRKGNQLLCTLILGNVIVNTLIAQITDRFTGGWFSIVFSTALITLGGEILPQATMAAHALEVGAKSAPVVNVFLSLFYPVCKPLSIFLDWAIGEDPGQIYQREELKKLFALHAKQQDSGIHASDVNLLVGAMGLRSTTVESVMTPITETFMIEASERLDVNMIQVIWESGHSRVPVFKGHRSNIVGLLYAKDLLMVRPDEGARVHDVVKFHRRSLLQALSTTPLISMLKDFQIGNSHIALVKRVTMRGDLDPTLDIIGIVTLDDVITSLIGCGAPSDHPPEVLLEEDITQVSQVTRQLVTNVAAMIYGSQNARSDPWGITGALPGATLRLIRPAHMTLNHRKAVAYFLRESSNQFRRIGIDLLMDFIHNKALFYDVAAPQGARGLHLGSRLNVWLYRNGSPSNFFTLLVSGAVQVIMAAAKTENSTNSCPLYLELPPWNILGGFVIENCCAVGNDEHPEFVPDYSARIVSNSTVLQFHRLDVEELFTQPKHTIET